MHIRATRSTSNESGFTLIELLVVILIIGILAAIAVPSFLNQRQKGQDACAKSLARSMQNALETYYVDNKTYVGASPSALNLIESSIPPNGGAACGATWDVVYTGSQGAGTDCNGNTPAANAYCVFVPSTNNGFRIYRSSSGAIVRNCVTPEQGGCPIGGTW